MKVSTPASESSAAPKSLALLATFGIALSAIALVLAISTKPLALPKKAAADYDNAPARKMLQNEIEMLVISQAEKSTTIKGSQLLSWQNGQVSSAMPKTDTSLIHYVYAQTNSSHPWSAYDSSAVVKGLDWEDGAIGEWLLQQRGSLNLEAQNAELVIEDNKAVSFQPHQNGYTLELGDGARTIKEALIAGREALSLPLLSRQPAVKLADLNHFGIKELLAVGKSDFSGSSSARINNIRVGASKYNGVILMPGEEFSFNKYLGPVDAENGFKPELVIKPEGATPEFGGGLCQVSTTAFRAAFFGGLPITQRRNHSYAVKYYEWIDDDAPKAVGLDATIYAPYQDMKFVNDTAGALLIWTRIEGHRLYFDFYGTKDQRQVAVDGPHPYDRKPSGAIKSTVSRKVTKDGKTEEVTFRSVYIPPKVAEQSFQLPASPATSPPPATPPLPVTN
ncbi:MAG: hypothetical protein A3C85_04485 [Candidatus Doudnabacteria bacterium RIFCSPHIGHO2_02_FULL_48_21]|uniref:Peptidoglycan binding domain-containing protein n=1 Tax=Candidatus Doudnabacteria bacterium RIFCSPLOWO2_02_FULL_48_13 TaxID=1817845 RepID=A0A1F5QDC7_9BACT|nr:MAG: hypothetical protein A3K05_00580 [Candidatus Doudnabacteria bacterium RIFCSPHIGHO2_01_48_18]OGE79672.1 MAG: hypothetical protein A2668_01070 [Candidatus Doudnabacteria bacterium RIFCSPHIGHO2_01_FULL_48_180]OGE91472.1 MAG: hypothetical protein A3F44_01270 [Candidatus Doudnabacteria bacterium RIFCSPHIGHO2_12_FULL_47_25]OGE93087.1 MAG: hypothetical protein A3C85_04485 [Candidatus Doudnabacteria bacterium RIFCSPHIGHO2_02_FULL_48_21]OGE98094.1 MAG: hypothetical protein A3A83_02450 [Candidatu